MCKLFSISGEEEERENFFEGMRGGREVVNGLRLFRARGMFAEDTHAGG